MLQTVVAGQPNAGFISGILLPVLTTQQNRKGETESSIDGQMDKQTVSQHTVFYSFYCYLLNKLAIYPAVSKTSGKQQAFLGKEDWLEGLQGEQRSGVLGEGGQAAALLAQICCSEEVGGGWSNITEFPQRIHTLFSSLCLQEGCILRLFSAKNDFNPQHLFGCRSYVLPIIQCRGQKRPWGPY